MEFIKKNWQKILLFIFIGLFLTTCGNNCSNKNKIRNYNSVVAGYDSTINTLNDSIFLLNEEIDDMHDSIKNLNLNISLIKKSNTDLNRALKRNVVVNINKHIDEKE